MGLFAKIHAGDEPCLKPAGALPNRGRGPDSAQSRGSLYEKAKAFQTGHDGPSSAKDDRAMFETCLNRLSRLSPGDCDTALSVLRAFYPLDSCIYLDFFTSTPRVHAVFGLEMGSGSTQLERELLPAFSQNGDSVEEDRLATALLPYGIKNPKSIRVRRSPPFWVIFSISTNGNSMRELEEIFTSSLSNRFVPCPPAQTTESVIEEIFQGTGDNPEILHIGQGISKSDRTALRELSLPIGYSFFDLPDASLLFFGPKGGDVELLWYHLAKIHVKNSTAALKSTLYSQTDKKQLHTILDSHGYRARKI